LGGKPQLAHGEGVFRRPVLPLVSCTRLPVGGFGGATVLGVDALGFFELVFEDDDAAGGLDGSSWSTSSRARAAMRS
jgi:hypothetical protein